MSSQIRIDPSTPVHGEEEIRAAQKAAEQWWNVEGEPTREFSRVLGEYVGMKHVELVNSGSSANLAALLALTTNYIPEDRRLNRGDEVITTALSFPTTVSPIIYAGAIPVFVDVERHTWNISPIQVREMITSRTKAIMVAHAMGNPFNVKEIRAICNEFNLTLIEDNCDNLGSTVDGKRCGGFGDIATQSFYPAHHISTGEGGAVMTNNPRLHRAINSIINWGRDCFCAPGCDNTCGKRYEQPQQGELPQGYDHKNTYTEFGQNLKMSQIQAAIGVEQMKRLPGFVQARRFNHLYLESVFANFQQWFDKTVPYEGATMSPFGYVIKLNEKAPFTKKEFEQYLDEQGIKSRAFFCGNITKQPVLVKGGRHPHIKHEDLSVSDDIMENSFWIGVHPGIKYAQLEYMELKIVSFLQRYR
jgi:CDP-6-deoxy-D-xylo-4-hexulose-3-dehydrase